MQQHAYTAAPPGTTDMYGMPQYPGLGGPIDPSMAQQLPLMEQHQPLPEFDTGNSNLGILYHYDGDVLNRPNQGYSLEQSRFINRIKNASR